jgi:hypothetical protein
MWKFGSPNDIGTIGQLTPFLYSQYVEAGNSAQTRLSARPYSPRPSQLVHHPTDLLIARFIATAKKFISSLECFLLQWVSTRTTGWQVKPLWDVQKNKKFTFLKSVPCFQRLFVFVLNLYSRSFPIFLSFHVDYELFCTGVKLGHSRWGKNMDWGCLRTACLGEYLDLRGMKGQEAGENCWMNTSIICIHQILLDWSNKSRRMRWAGHAARMGEMRNTHRMLVGKPEDEEMNWKT